MPDVQQGILAAAPAVVGAPALPAQGQEPLDWNKLAANLGAGSVAEAQRRAYEIAKFVADVENDSESQLILKTGHKQLELKLNK